MHSLLINSRTGRAVMGGLQDKLIDFDFHSSKQISVLQDIKDGTNAILRDHSRFVVSGDVPNGRVHLRDPLTLKVAHTLDCHSGVLSDIDVHGHHLVTCGSHAASRAPDRFLMVYDLRILRAISPLQVMVVPSQLRFLPSMSSRIVVLSSLGQVQLVDTAALATPQMSMFQIHSAALEGCNIMSLDISPSNQCLAFGDNSNSINLYASVADPVLNPYARDSEFADPIEQLPPMDINDPLAIYASVPRPNLPPGQSSYSSDLWPERFMRPGYRPTPDVDAEILKSMKVVGNIGYSRNINNMKRNMMRYSNIKGRTDTQGNSRSGNQFKNDHDLDSSHANGSSAILNTIPKAYRKVAIKLSKMGTDDFDFDRYNRTGFCGLEASLPNAYCNAMLQILYYSERLRIILLNHTCSRENCVCCELSFIFHMMDVSPGMPCQSSNFLRALRTIPEASALGLVFTDQAAVWQSNVPRLVQSFIRFILQQIHMQISCPASGGAEKDKLRFASSCSPSKIVGGNKPVVKAEDMSKEISEALDQPRQMDHGEENEDESLVSTLFGMNQEKVTVCSRCKEKKSKNDTVLLCNLMYPEGKEDQKFSFQDIVCSSMCPEQSVPAWCDQCKKYQTTSQLRNLKTLPNILSLNAGMDSSQDVSFWSSQLEHLYNEHAPKVGDAEPFDSSKTAAINAAAEVKLQPANVKPCRYGSACSRPDCKFSHPADTENIPAEPVKVDIGAKCASLGLSWIPDIMRLNLHETGKLSPGIPEEGDEEDRLLSFREYELYGICWAILDPSTGKAINIVATINVGPTYHARIASPVSQWYVFNDFSITTITASEAIAVHPSWKIPCILFYQTKAIDQSLKEISFANPITSEVFMEDKSLGQRERGRKRTTFIPLNAEEMPKKGDLVAIDAEFVTLNQEESELRSDGKVSTIKAAQMSLARITCVRGSGYLEGTPFIDDYISTQEQVVDYVTKVSCELSIQYLVVLTRKKKS